MGVGDATVAQKVRHQLGLDFGVFNQDPVKIWHQEERVAETGELCLLDRSAVSWRDCVDHRLGVVVNVEVIAVALEEGEEKHLLTTRHFDRKQAAEEKIREIK